MKTTLRLTLFLALLAAGALANRPTSARVDAASNLQLTVSGRQAVSASRDGCTRVTNRFCVQSTKSNCFACR